MESRKLKYPKLIVLTVSVMGCFLGMLLIYPFCTLLGIDLNQTVNDISQLLTLLVALIIFTIFGYFSSCYLAAYTMVFLRIIDKSQVSELGIGGTKAE